MPRTQRTPPPCLDINSELKSDSDISIPVSNSPFENINTQSRQHKRHRAQSSPSDDFRDFKRDILSMLTSWKKDQEERLTKFTNDHNCSLNKLMSEIAELKQQNIAIQKTNSDIEKTISFISMQYDDMVKQINSLEREKQVYRESFKNLETKIKDLQKTTRSSSIEIRNVPPKDKESVLDLYTIIDKVATAVDMKISNNQVRDVYRLPGKTGTPRPIIAEFSNVQTKNQLITCVRNYNKSNPNEKRLNTQYIGMPGDCRPIYVADYLPASSKKLFFLAREFAKTNDFNYCWTANGNIFLRKKEGARQILIKSEQTLQDLILECKQ